MSWQGCFSNDSGSELTVLDISNNLIEDVTSLDELADLEELAELTIDGNPICSYPQLKEEILEICPSLENFNAEELTEVGARFKEEAEWIKEKIAPEIENQQEIENRQDKMIKKALDVKEDEELLILEKNMKRLNKENDEHIKKIENA